MCYKLTTAQGQVLYFHVQACAELFLLELGGVIVNLPWEQVTDHATISNH